MKVTRRLFVWHFLRYDSWRETMLRIQQTPSNDFHKMCSTDMEHLSRKRLKKLLMAAGSPRDEAEAAAYAAGKVAPLADYWCALGWSIHIPSILADDWKRTMARFHPDMQKAMRAIFGHDPTSAEVDDTMETLNEFLEKHPEITDVRKAREFAEAAQAKFDAVVQTSGEDVSDPVFNEIDDEAYGSGIASRWFEFAGFLPNYGLSE